jgi:glycosyltransferase involved in cell wall biosynthesis
MSDILVQLLNKLKTKTVSTVHTTLQGPNLAVRQGEKRLLEMDQSDFANLLLLLPLEVCEYLYLRRVSHLIATSNYIKMELQRHFPFVNNLHRYFPVVPNGVDTELFSPSCTCTRKDLQDLASLDRPIVLFTGRLVASKGIYTLIRAVPKILHAKPSAMLLFVGPGDPRQYVRELRSMGVPEENFRFLGYLNSYFDMPQVYSLARVFAVPTLYESFPLRILEAMSCEKAIVATNVCGIPEMIENGRNGILIQPGNYEELARNIILLLEDENLGGKLGKAARRTVMEKFSAARMGSLTFDAFRRCLGDQPSRL